MNEMKEKLINLYNTMILVETKGENTLIMADCIKFVRQCISELKDKDIGNDGADNESK